MKYDLNSETVEQWLYTLNQCLMHQIHVYGDRKFGVKLGRIFTMEPENEYLPSCILETPNGVQTEVIFRIVGFSGKAGSGKDTTADIYQSIVQELINQRIAEDRTLDKNYILQRGAFANTLKRICAELTGISANTFHTESGKASQNIFANMSNRKVAQIVGTECFRDNFSDDIWVKTTINEFLHETLTNLCHYDVIHETKPRTKATLIVSDVRFENEATAIRALQGDLAMVVNSNHEINPEVDGHRSEQLFPLMDNDVVIHNDGSSLTNLTDEVFRAFIERPQAA